jgi:hypothetical protein
LWVIFALLDLDPDSEYGSGSTDPIEYGSNTDPDLVFSLKFEKHLSTVLGIRIFRIRMYFGLPDPGLKNPDPRSRIEKSRSGMEKNSDPG